MRAAVLFRYNEPLKIEDIEIEDPKENEVMIQVVATGLCHSDVNVFIGLPPVSAETPFRVATIVRSGITIIGNYGARPRVDMPKILELVRTGKYDPSKLISGKFKLEEINEAVKLLEEGKAIRSLIIP